MRFDGYRIMDGAQVGLIELDAFRSAHSCGIQRFIRETLSLDVLGPFRARISQQEYSERPRRSNLRRDFSCGGLKSSSCTHRPYTSALGVKQLALSNAVAGMDLCLRMETGR